MRRLLVLVAALSLGAGWGADSFSVATKTVERVERMQGRPFDWVAVYDNLNRGAAFPNADAGAAMQHGATIFVNITATHVVQVGPDHWVKLPYCWRGIASGRRDDMLQAWTAALHASGYTRFVFTFAHEPDGGDNEHAPKCDSNTPADYRNAFARVARFFRGHNLFSPFAFMPILRHFDEPWRVEPYIPWGSFQIIGGDTYDHLDNWRTPAEMFGSFAAWRLTHAPELPVLIGEFGVDTRDARAPQTITDTAAYLQRTFPDLLALIWNVKPPWDVYTPDSRHSFTAASRDSFYGGGS